MPDGNQTPMVPEKATVTILPLQQTAGVISMDPGIAATRTGHRKNVSPPSRERFSSTPAIFALPWASCQTT